jgi:hypothetical protein
MSQSIRSADRTTHIKIVVVSLMAAILVVAVGTSARNFSIDEDSFTVTKAGRSMHASIKENPVVR